MANVCRACKKSYEGVRHRCPHCGSTSMGTMMDLSNPFGPSSGLVPPHLPPMELDEPLVDRTPVTPPPPPPRPAKPKPPRPEPPVESAAKPAPVAKPVPTARPVAAPPASRRPEPAPADSSRDAFRTIGISGLDISRINIAKHNYQIEILDQRGGWIPIFSVVGTVKTPAFGRTADPRLELMKTVAVRHLRFENTSKGLFVLPFDTVNGVYRRIRGPVELADGMRIRIGNYVMAFRTSTPPEPAEPKVVEGEHMLARDLWSLGFLDFIRPDDRPGVRYPILNPVATILGRGGSDEAGNDAHVDLPLLDDPKVSRRHARIAGRGSDRDRLTLQDLDSKTGTWVRLVDRTEVEDGDMLWLGEVCFRVVASR